MCTILAFFAEIFERAAAKSLRDAAGAAGMKLRGLGGIIYLACPPGVLPHYKPLVAVFGSGGASGKLCWKGRKNFFTFP